jgi:beta-N-acetylhexosaminidase
MTRTRRGIGLVLAGAIVSVTLGCSTSSSPRTPVTPPAATQREATERPVAAESCAARVFGRMTEPQRVGQLFLVGVASVNPGSEVTRAVRSYHFGSLLFTGDYAAGVRAIRAATDRMQALTTEGVRLFIAANQEGGLVQQLAGDGFSVMPSALAQGTEPVPLLRELAQTWGKELHSAGVNLNLAPVMDTVPADTASENAPIGVLGREFGHDPTSVAAHGVAFIQGMRAAGVDTTAKHFPGLGRVIGNTDFTAGVVDTVTTANDPYLRSFQESINAGVPFVMISLATYTRIDPGHLAVFSSRVMRVLLRDRMGFTGVIVSDDLGQAAAVASVSPAERALEFLNAGGDLITSQDSGPAISMYTAVLKRAATDAAFRSEVASAAMRVLSAKQAAGLLPCA